MPQVETVLTPSVVTGFVSRVRATGDALQRLYGMEIGGANVNQVSGRAYSWDIFDNVRTMARGRAPGTGPARVPVNPVGKVSNTFPRFYQKLECNYELLHNIRALGENAGVKDKMGIRYLEQQGKQEKRKHNNAREYMLAKLLTKGAFAIEFVGDDWYVVESVTTAGFTIDYQIPAGNKSSAIPGLDPLGAGNIIDASWATAGTNIPAHLDSISLAFQQLVGEPLAQVNTDSVVWNHVLNNTKVINQSGSVNTAFDMYEMEPMTNAEGKRIGIFTARLRCRPWIKWQIIDTGLEAGVAGTTYGRHYDGTKATFHIEHDGSWLKMQEGSEPVKENAQAEAVERFGFVSWTKEMDEPARVELHTLMNCVPELNIPKAIMAATVVG